MKIEMPILDYIWLQRVLAQLQVSIDDNAPDWLEEQATDIIQMLDNLIVNK